MSSLAESGVPVHETGIASRGIARLWLVIMLLMAITGMGQMPIFKRYYIADIPGFGWLADPYTVHWVHYLGAIALMGAGGWLVMGYLAGRARHRLTASGIVRCVLLLFIVATGYMRVAKNLPDVHFSPVVTMLVEWTHLGFAMMLGIAAIVVRLRGRGAYLRER